MAPHQPRPDSVRADIQVIVRKEDLDSQRLSSAVVIVIDTLFATTTIVAALERGAAAVVPALSATDAREIASSLGKLDGVLLAGELMAKTLAGFAPPTPLALAALGVEDKTIVYSTTNGTVALRQASGAHAVYAACLRNARATAQHILAHHPAQTVLIVCAGSAGNFNLEDFYTAGWLARHFVTAGKNRLNDAAFAAHDAAVGNHREVLLRSRVGQLYCARFPEEIDFAAEADCVGLVALFQGGRVTRL